MKTCDRCGTYASTLYPVVDKAGKVRMVGSSCVKHYKRAKRSDLFRSLFKAEDPIRKTNQLIELASRDTTPQEEARTACVLAAKLIKKHNIKLVEGETEIPKSNVVEEQDVEPEQDVVYGGGGRGKRLADIRPTDRIVMSKRKLTIYDITDTVQADYLKPEGLWYSIGRAWLEWMEGEMPEWIGRYKYTYKIEVNESNLLILRNDDETENFANKYAINKYGSHYIDWNKLSSKYDGIEINPYEWGHLRWKYNWYNAWDLSSGCIWKKRAVISIKELDCEPADCSEY